MNAEARCSDNVVEIEDLLLPWLVTFMAVLEIGQDRHWLIVALKVSVEQPLGKRSFAVARRTRNERDISARISILAYPTCFASTNASDADTRSVLQRFDFKHARRFRLKLLPDRCKLHKVSRCN